jgi:tRNA (guanine-N7-)-methyltransferase
LEWLRYHIYPEYFEKIPPNWSEIFGREAPIWVEIGFGNGEFLLHLSKKYSEVNLVGFELSITSFVKAQKKFYSAGVENVRLVMVDGRFGLRELFEDDSVDRVFVNFPCPWSKKGYEDRRITTDDFIKTLSAVLKPSGVFELMTDDKKYAGEV